MSLTPNLAGLTPTQLRLVDYLVKGKLLWMPHPDNHPQMSAYVSEADILYYGGAAGGGKSDLLLGLAVTDHRKAIIYRREYPQLRELIDRSYEVLQHSGAKYNQTNTCWRGIPGRRALEFGAVQHEKDKEKFKGRPHDLVAFDEIADFTESQFRFLIAWNRTTIEDQRCRVVCAGNPPTHSEGEWVIRYWAPWLSKYYPNPAKPGELRWFINPDGKDIETDGPAPVSINGETLKPLSRTFIPARLSDNPYLNNTNYEAVLQGLPEPLKSQLLRGLFVIDGKDPARQVIPTAWIRLAQDRWSPELPSGLVLTSVGVDPSRGGADETAVALRAGNYYYEILMQPGIAVPTGPACAAFVIESIAEDPDVQINVDIIGIGSSVYDTLIANNYLAVPVNFASGSSAKDASGELSFRNLRAEAYWKFREALDPETGSNISLPPDEELIAELAAPRWEMSVRGITLESKKSIRKRLRRSPNKADAVVLANFKPVTGVFFR